MPTNTDGKERGKVLLLASLTGMSKAEIARHEGISVARLSQLIERGVREFNTMKGHQ